MDSASVDSTPAERSVGRYLGVLKSILYSLPDVESRQDYAASICALADLEDPRELRRELNAAIERIDLAEEEYRALCERITEEDSSRGLPIRLRDGTEVVVRHSMELAPIRKYPFVSNNTLLSVRDHVDSRPESLRMMQAYALLRDGLRCQICKRDIRPGEQQIDHIIPRVLSGPHHRYNLRVTHGFCNSARGYRSDEEVALAVEQAIRDGKRDEYVRAVR